MPCSPQKGPVRLQNADEETEHEGAQSSAAWCLSAVLFFMSLLPLRQAFEPLSRQDDVTIPAQSLDGQNRHIAKGLMAPGGSLQGSNSTSAILLFPSGSAMGPDLTHKEVTYRVFLPCILDRKERSAMLGRQLQGCKPADIGHAQISPCSMCQELQP